MNIPIKQHFYDGPTLQVADIFKPFWNKEKTKPLGGCIKAELLYVVDGDTAVFLVDGNKETVRFFIIDTPELRPNQQPFALEAKEFLESLFVNAEEIYLQSDLYDDLRDTTDSKRLLAWLWVNGELVNYKMIQEGFAMVRYVASPYLKYLQTLKQAEIIAKLTKLRIHQKG